MNMWIKEFQRNTESYTKIWWWFTSIMMTYFLKCYTQLIILSSTIILISIHPWGIIVRLKIHSVLWALLLSCMTIISVTDEILNVRNADWIRSPFSPWISVHFRTFYSVMVTLPSLLALYSYLLKLSTQTAGINLQAKILNLYVSNIYCSLAPSIFSSHFWHVK